MQCFMPIEPRSEEAGPGKPFCAVLRLRGAAPGRLKCEECVGTEDRTGRVALPPSPDQALTHPARSLNPDLSREGITRASIATANRDYRNYSTYSLQRQTDTL
ncbi:hypothetical protein Hamer_G003786 [Homarus americanus]|uniref:Uncharacterized protein n=1 Tax=Homarus americanus TaxID=6706 RepID=A0A8J5NG12_HOMAM|nr:hypothetical protein Hamer_G003786 [Homarus americanus]